MGSDKNETTKNKKYIEICTLEPFAVANAIYSASAIAHHTCLQGHPPCTTWHYKQDGIIHLLMGQPFFKMLIQSLDPCTIKRQKAT